MSTSRAALFLLATVALVIYTRSKSEPAGAESSLLRAQIIPAQATEPFPALGCYQDARSRTMLSQYDAYLLCRGAASAAPVACYERATQSAVLTYQALALCRCAADAGPIECFERAQSSTLLGQNEIIELCSATVNQRVYQDCTPIR